MTGGDRIRCRDLYQHFFTFAPTFTAILCTNHRPVVKGTDRGLWRRFKLVPFDAVVPPEQMDPFLPDKLKQEPDGILAWPVKGAVRYLSKGIQTPHIVECQTEGYRSEADVIRRFFHEQCECDGDSSMKLTDLKHELRTFSVNEGVAVPTANQLKVWLRENNLETYKNNATRVRGVHLAECNSEPDAESREERE